MAQFEAFEPGTEVIGKGVTTFLAGFPEEFIEVGLKTLAKYGIKDLDPDQYYPLQAWLDAMKDINDNFGPQMLFRIGEQVATHAVLPPGIDSLETALSSIDVAYKMNHRGSDNIGSYSYTYLGNGGGMNKAKMVCANPYPSSFDRGLIEGFAKRFKPEGCEDIIVKLDDTQPTRLKGDESCTYTISWC